MSSKIEKIFKEKTHIWIKGARLHNLKNIEVLIPKYKMIAVTGLSGSGKSSLIMDTLYAEGQRRYVESLSSYARQFLARMKKPEVDFIKGLCPAIAVEQKVVSGNNRSTVGSMTELYDLLRVLYARIGKTISPISNKEVKKHSVSDVMDYIGTLPEQTKILIISPLSLHYQDRSLEQQLNILLQKGYTRLIEKGEIFYIEDWLKDQKKPDLKKTLSQWYDKIHILIDRIVSSQAEDNLKRTADSIQTAFLESDGGCGIFIVDGKEKFFSSRFELDDILFVEPSPQLFNYNNPFGACPDCEGYGMTIGIDPDKVVPDDNVSIADGAIAAWTGEKSSAWLRELILAAEKSKIPIHKPFKTLSDKQMDLVWDGNQHFLGLHAYFDELRSHIYKIQNRVILARFRGRTVCRTCEGRRLRIEANYVKIDKTSIGELIHLPLRDLKLHFQKIKFTATEKQIAKRLLYEINSRLNILFRIGLGYLTLDRISVSLSGGETQRINLTRLLGSNLSDSLYILDEPSIGLHPKDTAALIEVLAELRDIGNTVIVVEHEDQVIRACDQILDIGPAAGNYGGEVMYNGPIDPFVKKGKSLTAEYLRGDKVVKIDSVQRKLNNKIKITGANQFNLKNIDVEIPLFALSVVTGVSGSGKSTLINDILYPALRKKLGLSFKKQPGKYKSISGDINLITQIESISQRPIGRSSRSNPATYTKVYDIIRQLFIKQQLSKIRGYKPKHFSFNVDGGRCDTCKGEGSITVEMQFLADIKLVCDTCGGKKFKSDILEVRYNEKNIHEVLELSISEALTFFEKQADIVRALQPLDDVGLDYVKLGQSSSTLSGGEAQRLKLAFYLSKEKHREHILFLFDEPTTGLHFHDINKLLTALNMLVERGNTVVVIEHNMDLIRNADYIIDLGPGGGDEGGELIYQGRLEGIKKIKRSYTGQFLSSSSHEKLKVN